MVSNLLKWQGIVIELVQTYCLECGYLHEKLPVPDSVPDSSKADGSIAGEDQLASQRRNEHVSDAAEKVMKAIVDNNRGSAFNPSGLCLKR
ncbi:hypothetical protein CUMW_194160 [Citrus unshiu]|nr:hypothetical protein CUMW_194160 [Citrus unshiu]